MSLLPEVRQSASKGDCSQAVSNEAVKKQLCTPKKYIFGSAQPLPLPAIVAYARF
jgi:hypothetical protein